MAKIVTLEEAMQKIAALEAENKEVTAAHKNCGKDAEKAAELMKKYEALEAEHKALIATHKACGKDAEKTAKDISNLEARITEHEATIGSLNEVIASASNSPAAAPATGRVVKIGKENFQVNRERVQFKGGSKQYSIDEVLASEDLTKKLLDTKGQKILIHQQKV